MRLTPLARARIRAGNRTLFKRMKQFVQQSIETALASRTRKRQQDLAEDQALTGEIAVLERHSSLVDKVANAKNDFGTLSATLKERYSGDVIPELAAQMAADST